MGYVKRAMMDLSALISLHCLNTWNVKATDLGIRPCLKVQADLGGNLSSLLRKGTWLFCTGQMCSEDIDPNQSNNL